MPLKCASQPIRAFKQLRSFAIMHRCSGTIASIKKKTRMLYCFVFDRHVMHCLCALEVNIQLAFQWNVILIFCVPFQTK